MSSSSGTLGRFVAALRGCGVQPSDRVAVALSGGPDSLALAAMTVWWHGFTRSRVSAAQPPPACCRRLLLAAALFAPALRLLICAHCPALSRLVKETPMALVVDHQLRPESSEEAAAVARQVWCSCRCMPATATAMG